MSDQYAPSALLSAGCVAELVEDLYSVSCIQDIESSIGDFIQAFESWEAQQYQASFDALKDGLVNTVEVLSNACQYQSQTLWGTVVGYFKKAIGYFFPEELAAYQLVVNGVNLYDNFACMMDKCSDGVEDYVGCGVCLGDIVYRVSQA